MGKAAALLQAFLLKSASIGFRFLRNLCCKFTLEPSTQWASGHGKCCNTRVVPVSKVCCFSLTFFEWHIFLKVTFQSAKLVIVVNVFSNILEYVAN